MKADPCHLPFVFDLVVEEVGVLLVAGPLGGSALREIEMLVQVFSSACGSFSPPPPILARESPAAA